MQTKLEQVAVAISGAPFPTKASLRKARAAIEAMRVPTPAMVDAHFEAHAKADTFFASAEDVFNAMIDAALKEGSDGAT